MAPAAGLEDVRGVFAQPELVTGLLNRLEPCVLDELEQACSARCLGLRALLEGTLARGRLQQIGKIDSRRAARLPDCIGDA